MRSGHWLGAIDEDFIFFTSAFWALVTCGQSTTLFAQQIRQFSQIHDQDWRHISYTINCCGAREASQCNATLRGLGITLGKTPNLGKKWSSQCAYPK